MQQDILDNIPGTVRDEILAMESELEQLRRTIALKNGVIEKLEQSYNTAEQECQTFEAIIARLERRVDAQRAYISVLHEELEDG